MALIRQVVKPKFTLTNIDIGENEFLKEILKI